MEELELAKSILASCYQFKDNAWPAANEAVVDMWPLEFNGRDCSLGVQGNARSEIKNIASSLCTAVELIAPFEETGCSQ